MSSEERVQKDVHRCDKQDCWLDVTNEECLAERDAAIRREAERAAFEKAARVARIFSYEDSLYHLLCNDIADAIDRLAQSSQPAS
jgi:hypothetical protein